LARLSAVLSDRTSRKPGATAAALGRLWDKIKNKIKPGHAALLSGASGAADATAEERAFIEDHALKSHGDLAVRATGSYVGHAMEPQFAMNIALATVALNHDRLFPPADASGLEKPMGGKVDQVLVTGVGHWRGEGLALVERVG
jgi:3-oxoacyl-[acyl-carrier-protein] synthase II